MQSQDNSESTCTTNRSSTESKAKYKLLLFKMLAVFVVPALFLVFLEIALRLSGYGFQATYFLTEEIEGEEYFIENKQFGWLFFPRSISRSPPAQLIKKQKEPGTTRILVFGESAALGDPKPAFSMGRYLSVLLNQRYPEQRFEVISMTMTAINSHALLRMAKEAKSLKADYWIIYCGNNEMMGPFGASVLFGQAAPSNLRVRVLCFLNSTKVGQLITEAGNKVVKSEAKTAWEGMRMFAETRIEPDSPVKEQVYRNYRGNLEAMAKIGRTANAEVFLCTMVSNLKDFPPLASMHPFQDPETLQNFQEKIRSASESSLEERYEKWLEVTKIAPNFAEGHFQVGQAVLALGNKEMAADHFKRARDSDALPFRTDYRQNKIVREISGGAESSGLIDLELAFESSTDEGIPGEEFFFDHVHFTFDGNYLVARVLAQALEQRTSLAQKQPAADWRTQEEVERLLGLTDWNREAAYRQMLQRLQEPPFQNQTGHEERSERFARQILAFRTLMHPSYQLDARATYEAAIAQNPKDHYLRENYAEFLEATGSLEEAADQWNQITLLLTHHHAAFYHYGRLLLKLGKLPEAEQALTACLRRAPHLVDARLELATVQFRQKQYEAALKELKSLEHQHPKDPRVQVRLADIMAAKGERKTAVEHLQKAVELRPSYWEARYMLGLELADQENFQLAAEHFREVIKLRPDHAPAHFNLGVALAKMGLFREALQSFRKTLEVNPEHALAAEYATKLEEALRSSTRRPIKPSE